jgi:glycosyltransferase involved in cell wall biosynthesis
MLSKLDTNDLKGISIIICCYNSEKRLPETIQHIGKQDIPPVINWEVIIIDNASKDNTRQVAQELCEKYLVNVPFKIVSESNPGLSSARKRGIQESTYEYLLFCDDDNWLASDYVKLAYNIMSDNPQIGVLGGQSIGEYEVSPPAWFVDNAKTFAIGKQGEQSGDITNKKGAVWGAGFIVRKSIFQMLQAKGFEFVLSDRKGEQLTSGGDRELCLVVKKLGYFIYYEEKLVTKHFMPASRFNFEGFLKLSYQNGKSSFVNDVYNDKVGNYGLYVSASLITTTGKLVAFYAAAKFCKVARILSSSNYNSERRVHYLLGRLNTLLNISYCRMAVKHVKKNMLLSSYSNN